MRVSILPDRHNALCRYWRRDWRKLFYHPVRIQSTEIIAAQQALVTIAVELPEGNGGLVRCCRLERDPANAAPVKLPLHLAQQQPSHTRPPVLSRDINGNDVGFFALCLGD